MPGIISRIIHPLLPVSPTESRRNAAVDGLRAVALSLVFMSHYGSFFLRHLEPGTFGKGWVAQLPVVSFGTSLFLVISGYGVYGQFLEGKKAHSPFLTRRLLRILPLYWAMLAVYVGLCWILPSLSKIPSGFPGFLYVVQNALLIAPVFHAPPLITVSWTLFYFVAAYVTIPLGVKVFRLRERPRWQRVAITGTGMTVLLSLPLAGIPLDRQPAVCALGMLLYEGAGCSWFKRLTSSPVAAASMLGALVAGLICLLTESYLAVPIVPPRMGQSLILVATLMCVCPFAVAAGGCWHGFLTSPRLLMLGRVSYCFYLSHGLCVRLISLVAAAVFPAGYWEPMLFWAAAPVCFAGCVVFSVAVFLLLERPLARLTEPWIAASRKQRFAAESAVAVETAA